MWTLTYRVLPGRAACEDTPEPDYCQLIQIQLLDVIVMFTGVLSFIADSTLLLHLFGFDVEHSITVLFCWIGTVFDYQYMMHALF